MDCKLYNHSFIPCLPPLCSTRWPLPVRIATVAAIHQVFDKGSYGLQRLSRGTANPLVVNSSSWFAETIAAKSHTRQGEQQDNYLCSVISNDAMKEKH